MKNINHQLTKPILLLTGILLSLTAIADDGNYQKKLIESESYLQSPVYIIDLVSDHQTVKILGLDDQLIAEGSSDDQIISKYLQVSDFLTEVNDTRYFRISYIESQPLYQNAAIQ